MPTRASSASAAAISPFRLSTSPFSRSASAMSFLPIAARLEGIEATYEQAARDLYATRAQAFRLILLPLLAPGLASGWLLAFIISLDDFIITNFVKGAGMETLPTAIFGSVKQGIKPNIMAISTLMLATSVLFVTAAYPINRKGQKTL